MHGLRHAPQCLKVNCSAALLLPQFPPCIRVPAYQPSRSYRAGFHVSNQNRTQACILLATGNTFRVNFHARLAPCATMPESELLRSFAASAIPNVYSCSGLSPYTLIHVRFPHIQSELHASVHSVGYGKHFQSKYEVFAFKHLFVL